VVIKLRSKRLSRLFEEVWERLPQADRTLLSKRIMLIVDSADFIPKGHRPAWGAAISIKFRKSIAIICLSPRKLPRRSDKFIRYVIAHLLAHVYCGHIESDEKPSVLEKEANAKAKRWGFPKVS
jgi:hypothetical protein